jgi:hypothetical protein
MVLNSMLLDVLPHLLDGAVEGLVRLLLRRNKVVRVMCGFARLAARLGERCVCRWGRCVCGSWGCGGGEGEDAGVGVEVVHFECFGVGFW